MTTHAAQHALSLPPVAVPSSPRRRGGGWSGVGARPSGLAGLGRGLALLAVWAAAWAFLLAGVAAPAGRLQAQVAQVVRPDRAGSDALARARLPPPPVSEGRP
jgi:hypothetical protein